MTTVDRAASISFIVALLIADLFFRLSEPEVFRAGLLISIVLALALFAAKFFLEKLPMYVVMFPAGFAVSSIFKWLLLA